MFREVTYLNNIGLFTKMKTKSLAYNVRFSVNTGKGKGISSIFKTNPVSSSGDGRQWCGWSASVVRFVCRGLRLWYSFRRKE
jgi:hypothetical protein